MASEEDNFDIDIYGDGEGDIAGSDSIGVKVVDQPKPTVELQKKEISKKPEPQKSTKPVVQSSSIDRKHTPQKEETSIETRLEPENPPVPQGTKRKEISDDRPVDDQATNALMISDLHWWITEDDLRGWINQAGAEDELSDITFSEHKVNGKSKGQVYLEFSSLQASTATKNKIESLAGAQSNPRKFSVAFTASAQNPFKTLPKDGPARAKDDRTSRSGTSPYSSSSVPQTNYNNNNNNYRGGRGGGYNRGGYNQGGFNRNFSGPTGGYNNNANNANNFQSNMGMMNSYGGFNRGGMMGNNMRGNFGNMRGNRGGMNNTMPMGGNGMGMGNMGMGMGMNMNSMMTGMGFNNNQFNPAMFNQGQNFGGGDWNQQGNKRQRQE